MLQEVLSVEVVGARAEHSDRSKWVRFGAFALGLALFLGAHLVTLPGAQPVDYTVALGHTQATRHARDYVLAAGELLSADDPQTGMGLGFDPYLTALALSSILCLVGSALAGRRLRAPRTVRAGLVVWVVLLVGITAWQGWSLAQTWSPTRGPGGMILIPGGPLLPDVTAGWVATFSALASLALLLGCLLLGRVAGVSLVALALALQVLGGALVPWALDLPVSGEVLAGNMVLDGAALAALVGGLLLVWRARVQVAELRGALSAAPTPPEVALLPMAWIRLLTDCSLRSQPWLHATLPGPVYDLVTGLGGRATLVSLLCVGALVALYLLLRQDRRPGASS